METKFYFLKVKKINEAERTVDAVASTTDRDRHNDIVLPGAFKSTLPAFKANPVILACHQHRLSSGSSPVIGSAIPESITIGEKDVRFTMRFATTPLGEEYWTLYKDKHMRAFSIGFIPIEFTDEKDEKLGWVRTYTKIELLEISAVPVPANRRALIRAKGFYDDSDVDKQLAEIVAEVKNDFLHKLDDSLEEIKDMIIANAESGGLAENLLGGEDSEKSDSGGDEEKSAQIMETLNEINSRT